MIREGAEIGLGLANAITERFRRLAELRQQRESVNSIGLQGDEINDYRALIDVQIAEAKAGIAQVYAANNLE